MTAAKEASRLAIEKLNRSEVGIMDIAVYIFVAGIVTGVLVALFPYLSAKKNCHVWKVEALELRDVRAKDEIARKYERSLLETSRGLSERRLEALRGESKSHVNTMGRLRDEKEKVLELTEKYNKASGDAKEMGGLLDTQRKISEDDGVVIECLKQRVRALRGNDTKRVKKLHVCCINKSFRGEGFYAYSLDEDCKVQAIGPTRPTKWQARRSFESIMGLRGKIQWEGE